MSISDTPEALPCGEKVYQSLFSSTYILLLSTFVWPPKAYSFPIFKSEIKSGGISTPVLFIIFAEFDV